MTPEPADNTEPLLAEMFRRQDALGIGNTQLAALAGLAREHLIRMRRPRGTYGKATSLSVVRKLAAALGYDIALVPRE